MQSTTTCHVTLSAFAITRLKHVNTLPVLTSQVQIVFYEFEIIHNLCKEKALQWCLLYTTAWCWSRDADQ